MRVARLIVIPLVAAVGAATISAAGPATAASESSAVSAVTTRIGFKSTAWSTYVTAVDRLVQSGPVSSASIGCTSVVGLNRTNSVASATLPAVGRSGALTSRVTTSSTPSTTASSSTKALNLLGGAVTADAVTVTATASNATGTPKGSGSTTFAGLKILGRSISATVSPNTKISLDVGGATVGTVTLNYQGRSTVDGVYTASTRGIVINLLAGNPYGLPGATAIYVGGANAGITTTPKAAATGGSGWGVSATALDKAALIGRQPHVGVPCYGGSGYGNVATITRDPLLSTGTTTVRTTSVNTTTATSSRVITTVAAPKVLSGLISAEAIIADSRAVLRPDGVVGVVDSSKFVGLKVAGLPAITSTVAPNTKVTVPGLGAVTFHKAVRTSRGLEVVMLEIVLNQTVAGLPTGTVVQVAGANATVIR